jgi:hypothetical protein
MLFSISARQNRLRDIKISCIVRNAGFSFGEKHRRPDVVRWYRKFLSKTMAMRTEDPDWVRKTCQAIAELDRYDLCTLYTGVV